jgi:hypothetical protein
MLYDLILIFYLTFNSFQCVLQRDTLVMRVNKIFKSLYHFITLSLYLRFAYACFKVLVKPHNQEESGYK